MKCGKYRRTLTGKILDMSGKHIFFPFQSDLFGFVSGCLPVEKTDSGKTSPGFPPAGSEKKNILRSEETQRTIHLDGTTVSYLLRRSSRRTIGFLIDESGLRVTAPKRSTIHTIENALTEKRKWILGKLDDYRNRQQAKPAPVIWQDGTTFPYLGKELTLHLEKSGTRRPAFRLDEDRLTIHLAQGTPAISDHLKKWLKIQARKIFTERLQLYAEKMNVTFDAFGLSGAHTRWGSCSARRHIRLNWRLVHCDISLIDYVVIHELAHLSEMNHSPRFWAIVKKWYTDPGNARKILQNLSPCLFSLFAETN